MHVGRWTQPDPIAGAAATYFGIDRNQLRQDLAAAGSLRGVAAKYGKDTAAGKAGLEAALEAALRQSLVDRGASADRINQAVERFKQNFDRLYTAPLGRQGSRAPGGFGRGPRQAPTATPTGGRQ